MLRSTASMSSFPSSLRVTGGQPLLVSSRPPNTLSAHVCDEQCARAHTAQGPLGRAETDAQDGEHGACTPRTVPALWVPQSRSHGDTVLAMHAPPGGPGSKAEGVGRRCQCCEGTRRPSSALACASQMPAEWGWTHRCRHSPPQPGGRVTDNISEELQIFMPPLLYYLQYPSHFRINWTIDIA